MRAPPSIRPVMALLWTVVVAAGLYGVDRLLVPQPLPRTWAEAGTPAEVPAELGATYVPAYLPQAFTWPPARVFYRGGETPGWWLGLRRRDAEDGWVWIGAGQGPPPPALGDGARCLESRPEPGCPPGWHQLSSPTRDGDVVHVVGTVDPRELRRILAGLQRTPGER